MGVRSYKILDQAGVNLLSIKLLREVNERIKSKITKLSIVDPRDDVHVPTVSAVAGMIARSRFVHMVPIIGDINEEVSYNDRNSGIIYLQKDDLYDSTWTMYIWVPPDEETGEDGYWIDLGSTNPDITECWTKDEESLAELRRALHLEDILNTTIESCTEEEIIEAVNAAKEVTVDVYDE